MTKRFIRLFTIGSILLILQLNLQGQYYFTKYPVRFGQYYKSYPFVNPAYTGRACQAEVTFGNKRLLGNYSKFSTYYLHANTRLNYGNSKNKTPFSAVGLTFYNDRDGLYINRSRMYASYAWHGNLTKRILFSGGFHIGGMNYNVKGTALSGNGSDWQPDAVVGVCVYGANFHSGASVAQIFNTGIQPLEEITQLPCFGNVTAGYKFNINSFLQLYTTANVMLAFTDNLSYFDGLVDVIYKKRIALALGVHNNNNVLATLSFKNLVYAGFNSSIYLSYGFTTGSQQLSTNFAEIGARVFLSNSNSRHE